MFYSAPLGDYQQFAGRRADGSSGADWIGRLLCRLDFGQVRAPAPGVWCGLFPDPPMDQQTLFVSLAPGAGSGLTVAVSPGRASIVNFCAGLGVKSLNMKNVSRNIPGLYFVPSVTRPFNWYCYDLNQELELSTTGI